MKNEWKSKKNAWKTLESHEKAMEIIGKQMEQLAPRLLLALAKRVAAPSLVCRAQRLSPVFQLLKLATVPDLPRQKTPRTTRFSADFRPISPLFPWFSPIFRLNPHPNPSIPQPLTSQKPRRLSRKTSGWSVLPCGTVEIWTVRLCSAKLGRWGARGLQASMRCTTMPSKTSHLGASKIGL